LATTVGEVVDAHPDEWGRYRQGEDKLAQFFIGQVMKATKGQANGKAVVAELQRLKG
jgi:aspartyl-tRNA(Asn)/glutamyl-tRNA(Gln) amidotransferase subunit B